MLEDKIDNVFFLLEKELFYINNLNELNILNSKYLGKNGLINKFFIEINSTKNIDRINVLSKINILKKKIFNLIQEKKNKILNKPLQIKIDYTIPYKKIKIGNINIITNVIEKINYFFSSLGFLYEKGIEIDNLYFNFDSLNIPKDHPSRKYSDTFYLNECFLLRTHTSNMQTHLMEKKIPPIKILSYGKVYRKDYDLSHTPMFHQVEGFCVDTNISLSNLKFILYNFLKFFFEMDIKIKFRSSFFPFTEPSFEVDMVCIACNEKGCKLCKYTGVIEILGCGMINPIILKNSNINNRIYNGFAFGIGIERLSMIKYKVTDIKNFYENNLDFLTQF